MQRLGKTKEKAEIAQWEEQIDASIFQTEKIKENPKLDDIIQGLIDKDIIDDESQVDKETGTITTNEPVYDIEDKLDDYLTKEYAPITFALKPQNVSVSIKNHEMIEGDFTIQLQTESGTLLGVATNDESGKCDFEGIEQVYIEPGTYRYKLKQENRGAQNVTYDENEYIIEVIVEDKDGVLVAKLIDVPVVFNNSYLTNSTSVVLSGIVILQGGPLENYEFKIQLKDDAGNIIETVKNGDNGAIKFSEIIYTKPGTYKYTISQIDTNEQNIIYDLSEYKVTVEVEDNGRGALEASIIYDNEVMPSFINKYYKDEEVAQ